VPTRKHKNEATESETIIKGPVSLAQSHHSANYIYTAFGHLSACQEGCPSHPYDLDHAQISTELCLFLKK